MCWDFIIALILIAVFATIINGVEAHNKKSQMSFREAMDLVGLPIVTFYQGDKKLNFLLDTGSNLSVINEAALESIEHETLDRKGSLYGVDGIKRETSFASIGLVYKKNEYREEFQVTNMQAAIDEIKAESGVNMIGIIGNDFFRRYKYILDFDELIAYSK